MPKITPDYAPSSSAFNETPHNNNVETIESLSVRRVSNTPVNELDSEFQCLIQRKPSDSSKSIIATIVKAMLPNHNITQVGPQFSIMGTDAKFTSTTVCDKNSLSCFPLHFEVGRKLASIYGLLNVYALSVNQFGCKTSFNNSFNPSKWSCAGVTEKLEHIEVTLPYADLDLLTFKGNIQALVAVEIGKTTSIKKSKTKEMLNQIFCKLPSATVDFAYTAGINSGRAAILNSSDVVTEQPASQRGSIDNGASQSPVREEGSRTEDAIETIAEQPVSQRGGIDNGTSQKPVRGEGPRTEDALEAIDEQPVSQQGSIDNGTSQGPVRAEDTRTEDALEIITEQPISTQEIISNEISDLAERDDSPVNMLSKSIAKAIVETSVNGSASKDPNEVFWFGVTIGPADVNSSWTTGINNASTISLQINNYLRKGFMFTYENGKYNLPGDIKNFVHILRLLCGSKDSALEFIKSVHSQTAKSMRISGVKSYESTTATHKLVEDLSQEITKTL